jgi:hypothetical protein
MRVFQILAGSLAIAMCLQCANSQIAPQDPRQNGFSVIEFPKPFVRGDSSNEKTIIISDDYEIRKLSNASRNELLFTVKDYDGTYSADVFGVDLDGKYNVRPVSLEEWGQGQRLSNKRYDVYAHETSVNGDAVAYRGKMFKRTGKSWESTAALPSPDGKWLAVFSHTSEKDLPSYGVMGGGGRGKGEMFVDVYNASSAKRVFSAHVPHRGGDQPSRFFNSARWVGNSYLTVPIDTEPRDRVGSSSAGERCLLAIMPEK